MKTTLHIATCTAALLATTLAHAQDGAEDEAAANYQIAVDLLNEGRYAESVDAFTRAIELSPDPVFYCNRSAALVRLKEYDRAIADLTHCRDTIEDAPEIAARADAQLKGLATSTNTVQNLALGVARDIAAGPIVKGNGDGVGDPGEVRPVEQGLSGVSIAGGVMLGLGVASLGTAGAIDFLSADVVAAYKDASTSGERTEYDRLRADVEQRQQLAVGAAIGGASLVTLGAALLIVDAVLSESPASPGATLRVGPAGVEMNVRF